MPHTVLVIGAAGFAGSHLLDLLSGTARVVAWRRPGGHPPPEAPKAEWQAVDLLDGNAVRQALASVCPNEVYHCAGAAHVGQAWKASEATLTLNVRGTHHVLKALHESGIAARVLIPSSALVYKPADEALTENHPLVPSGPYGLSKLAQEMLGQRADDGSLVVTLARAFNHVGPRQDPSFSASGFARQIARIERGHQDAELVVGNLDAERDITDVRDTVRAYRAILEHGAAGRPYNVCSGRTIPIRDLLQMLLDRATTRVRVRVDPALHRPDDAPRVLGDRSRIEAELGWTPAISLSQTLDDLLAYWRDRERSA